MAQYLFRRSIYLLSVLLGVALLTFTMFTLFGEDPARNALGLYATAQDIMELRVYWGLHLPVYEQFLLFIKQIILFDFGNSYSTGESVVAMFKNGVLVSLALTLPPYLVSLLLSICLALLVGFYKHSFFDRSVCFIMIISSCFSYLVYVIAFQYFLAYKLELFPIQGYRDGWAGVTYFLAPWLISIVASLGGEVRVFRSFVVEESKAGYIGVLKAKGLNEVRIWLVHILKNTVCPILTRISVDAPFLISGAFILERYFSIPGVGDMMIVAIEEGDFPVIKGMTMLVTIVYAVLHLVLDVLCAVIDPRIELN